MTRIRLNIDQEHPCGCRDLAILAGARAAPEQGFCARSATARLPTASAWPPFQKEPAEQGPRLPGAGRTVGLRALKSSNYSQTPNGNIDTDRLLPYSIQRWRLGRVIALCQNVVW